MQRRAVAAGGAAEAAAKTREAQEKLAKARLPVDEGGVQVAQRALELVERDYAVKREEAGAEAGDQAGRGRGRPAGAGQPGAGAEAGGHPGPASTGIVTAGDVKVGDVLEPGKPVVEIAEQAGFRFEASVPSEEVGHLRVGMPARIKLDAYDYQRYGTLDGTVCFLSPDSGVRRGEGR